MTLAHLKALVLAGGGGTRLRPLTYTTAKQLLPVAGKPIFHYVLEQLSRAGLIDVGVIVSPGNREGIESALGDGARWGLKLTYIVQHPPLGLADAVRTGQPYLGDHPFLVFLGDNIFQDELRDLVQEYAQRPDEALIVVKKVPNPQAFGVVEVDSRGRPVRLAEKPKEPRSNLAIAGIYFFPPVAHEVIASLKPSARGEYELTDTIQGLIDRGHPVRLHILKGWWLDTGRKDDMLLANRTLLDARHLRSVQGSVDAASQLVGDVELGPGCVVEASRIEGPVTIGEACRISRARVGPYVSLGARCKLDGTTVTDSILMDGCELTGPVVLVRSLTGRSCRISARTPGGPLSLLLADHSQVEG